MGLRAPSLKNADWEVSGRKKLSTMQSLGSRRSVKVILWKVDGSALAEVGESGKGGSSSRIALWKRIMCISPSGRMKDGPPGTSLPETTDSAEEEDDMMYLEKSTWSDNVSPKLQQQQQTATFGMRRWPQGWV